MLCESIPAKSYQLEMLIVSARDMICFGVVMVIAVPIGLIITGIMIWMGRRKR